MRISPPLAVVGLILASLTVLALVRSGPRVDSVDERCAVLGAYIATVVSDEHVRGDGNPIAFRSEPEDPGISIRSELSRNPEFRAQLAAHPLADLYLALESSKAESPTKQCPTLVDSFKKKDLKGKIFLDRFQGQRPVNKEGSYDVVFLTVSMPAISKNGQEAILFSGLVYAPLGGGGSEIYMRKDRMGRWRVLYQSGTWIS